MESSPLMKAYEFAKSSDHVHASGEFAKAAEQTSSSEAHRALKLLEEHHRRLSELLSINRAGQAGDQNAAENHAGEAQDDGPSRDGASTAGTPNATSSRTPPQVPALAHRRRAPPRDLTSSIASNLASARGIRGRHRSQALSPSVSNDQAPGNLEVRPRSDSSQGKMQNMVETSNSQDSIDSQGYTRDPTRRRAPESGPSDTERSTTQEDGYSTFYNTFGSILSFSAPLAFAGLPLIAEESTLSPKEEIPEPVAHKRTRVTRKQSTVAEPELSKIYSKATLKAIARDGSDSFYVVPSTGHTASYANILSYAEKEKRRQEASGHGTRFLDDEDDDFVDATESPTQLSPAAKRRAGKAKSEKDYQLIIEELCTENRALKDALDKSTKRLHAFEASAQTSHMALAESIRMMRPGSPISTGSGRMTGSDDNSHRRLQELEEQLAMARKDNEKKQRVLNKYRDQWEKLKAGAKARRDANTQNAPDNVGEDG